MTDLVDIRKQKEEIRREIKGILRQKSPASKQEESLNIQEELLSSEEFNSSKTVMTYVSLPNEVDTMLFIEKALERGKKVVVPRIDITDETITAVELTSINELAKGPFGVYEPKNKPARKVDLKEIDLIVVPGIAFDKENMRLGRGRGYYDRFLSDPDLSSATTIGLAYKCQKVNILPSDPHDRPVMRVITN
jgi:5-formyltetrahydrofolate cyclo-ligase